MVLRRHDRGALRGTPLRKLGGLVLIDGAYPIAMFDEAGKEKVRREFRRLGWIMRILAALGRSARMSPAESADVVIEMDAVNGELGPDFAALECPTVFVVGTGAHSGATEEEMRTVRAAVAEAEASNPRVRLRDDAPQAHADPQQGPRHSGRRDRGCHPPVFVTAGAIGLRGGAHVRLTPDTTANTGVQVCRYRPVNSRVGPSVRSGSMPVLHGTRLWGVAELDVLDGALVRAELVMAHLSWSAASRGSARAR